VGVGGCAFDRESLHRAAKNVDGRDKPGHDAPMDCVITASVLAA
jgi:hypothetical protein